MNVTSVAKEAETCHFHQFMAQVAARFPGYASGEWSPLERGIFNGLLANVIQRLGAAAVTAEMLDKVHDDMVDVVRQYSRWQTGK
jgi:hypothetical protein